jgi:hypothetical protein
MGETGRWAITLFALRARDDNDVLRHCHLNGVSGSLEFLRKLPIDWTRALVTTSSASSRGCAS